MKAQFAIACLGSLALLLAAATAQGSCGTAFCVLNTDWSTQGVAAEPGTAKLDLRYEFVDQKHLREGTRRIGAAEDPNDPAESRTINRNLVTTLDYALTKNWAASVSAPAVSRSHSHIADPTGTATQETWNFTKVGDARVLGHYRFDSAGGPAVNYGLSFGLKLPTGDYKVMNDGGVPAERMLQPGTGSTDAIAGGYYAAPGFHPDSSWFAQGLLQWAVGTKDEYRPGNQYQVNLGYRYPIGQELQGLLQLNALVRGHDSGANAEPDLSGSKTVFLSPGLSCALTHDFQIYSFLQLPIYRQVNGVQLSADWAFVAGATLRF